MADTTIGNLPAAVAALLAHKYEVEGSISEHVTGTQMLALWQASLSFQPLDSDLTAIAALATTSYGRALLALADAAAGRVALGLGTAATAATGDFDAAGTATGAVATHEADTTNVHGIADTSALLTTSAAAAAYQPLDSDLTAIAALATTSYGRALLALADASALRTAGGLVIGTNVQAYDAELAALAGLTSAADKGIQFTGAGTATTYDLTTAGKALLDDANASAQRATLGLGTAAVADTGVASGNLPTVDQADLRYQPLDSDLTAIAALSTTSYGRAFLALADAAAGRTALGLGTAALVDTGTGAANVPTITQADARYQPLDSDLTAIAALTTTSFGRSLLAAADAAALRVLAGAVIGTNVQAWDADLDAIAALSSTGYLQRTGSNTWSLSNISGDKLGLTPTAVKTANYSAAAGDFVPCDTSGSAFAVTFPTAPADGTVLAIKLVTAGNTLTLTLGGSDVFNKSGGAATGSLTLANQGIVCQYKATGAIWYVIADDLSLSGLDARYQALDSDLTTIAGLAATTDNFMVAAASAWASRTPAQARVQIGLDKRTSVSNTDYTILSTDRYVAQTGTMSAARTFTLPAASALNAGQELIIKDESGTVTSTNTITIARAGSDTIDGATSVVIRQPYSAIILWSDGSSGWHLDTVAMARGGAVAAGRAIISGGNTQLTLPGVVVSTVSAVAISANTVRYMPILVATTITLDRLLCEITSAGSGGTTARMGIYNSDLNRQPTTLVVDGGTVAVDSTGVKSATINTTLTPGLYLLAIASDGAPTIRTARGAIPGGDIQDAISGNIFSAVFRGALTYGALPSTGAAWTVQGAGPTPMEYFVMTRISVP